MTKLPTLVRSVRSLVYALCAAIFVWPLATPTAALAAATAAALGVWLGARVASTPLRSGPIVLAGLAAGIVAERALALAQSLPSLSLWLGDATALGVFDAARFSMAAGLVATVMCALSARHRFLAFVEVAAGGSVFSQLVAAHRHGAINRPFELADPIISTGGDPAVIFLSLGAFAALSLTLLLVLDGRWLQLLGHMTILSLFLLGAWWSADATGALPQPQPSGDGLGLQGKPKDDPTQRSKQNQGGRRRPDSDSLEFRDQQTKLEQQAPVAVVILHDDYSPPGGVYYFRQGAFSQFNGNRLIATTRDGMDRDVLAGFPVELTRVPEIPPAGKDRTTLETTVALMADHTRPFGLEAPVSFEPIGNSNPERFRRVYKVVSAPLTADDASLVGRTPFDPRWSEEDRKAYLELPPDPRYRTLATEIVKKIPPDLSHDPMLKAWTIRDYLSKEGVYSLRSKHASASDPTAHFLFGDKTGYCVHFSHAAVYLMRAVGVPARVATGYAVEESSRQGGSAILIASGAAHAWPEVYLAGLGWVVVDVQPERTLDPPPEAADADLQRLLGELARGIKPLPPDGSAPRAAVSVRLKEVALWLAGAAARVACALIAALYSTKLWRWLYPRFAGEKHKVRVSYRAALDRLAELGLVRSEGESPEAFAARVSGVVPSLPQLTQAHLGLALGSERARASAARTAPALSTAVRSERSRAFSLARRLVGALIPWSFLRTR